MLGQVINKFSSSGSMFNWFYRCHHLFITAYFVYFVTEEFILCEGCTYSIYSWTLSIIVPVNLKKLRNKDFK